MIKNTINDLRLPQNKLPGIYRGVVEDNNDPLKNGRCRKRVFGINTSVKEKSETEGKPTEELPSAEPALGLIEGSISGYGLFSVPLKGSHVFLFFENGNILQPRFFATVPGIPENKADPDVGFNDPDGVYPDRTGKDYEDGTGGSEYPHNIVLRTHGGIIMEINSGEGNKRVRVSHPVGSEIIIDNDGSIIITSDDECKILCGGECNLVADKVKIDGGTSNVSGVVTGMSICAFTGRPHGDTSTEVLASKGKLI